MRTLCDMYYHKTAVVKACSVSQGPEVTGRSQSGRCICLVKLVLLKCNLLKKKQKC